MSRLPPVVRLMRPHQYSKNLLIFAAPGAAGRLDEGAVLGSAVAAFALFCAVSSAGYVANDLLDAPADRLHPIKRNRPIASRSVSPRQALALLAALVVVALGGAMLVDWAFTAVLAGYGALTMLYSMVLKRVIWIELFAVSAGFLLRAVGGGAATSTQVSGWFLLVVSAGALLVIAGKRLGELAAVGKRAGSRKVLAYYSDTTLRRFAAVAAVVAVGGYVTWAAARANELVEEARGSLLLRMTALPFAIATGRYLVLAWRGSGETPESLMARDRVLVAAGLSWALLYGIGIYA